MLYSIRDYVKHGFGLIKQTTGTLSLRHLVKGVFVAALVYKPLEFAILDLEEIAGLSKFDDVPSVEDHLHKLVSM